MKIIYKIFIFAIILRLMPIVIGSMHIFSSTVFDSLGYHFGANDDIWAVLGGIVSPVPADTGIPIIDTSGVGHLSVQFGLLSFQGLLLAVGFLSAVRINSAAPAVGLVTLALIIPTIIGTGSLIRGGLSTYNSAPLTLLIISIIIGLGAISLITVMEILTHGDAREEG